MTSFAKPGQRKSLHDGDDSVSCKCLNVKFRLSALINTDDGHQDDHQLFAFDEIANSDIRSLLVNPCLVDPEVALQDFHGANVIYSYLVVAKQIMNWTAFSCFSCKTLTHIASLQKPDRVIVNIGKMLTHSQQKQVVLTDANYCKLFGIACFPVKNPSSTRSTLKPSVVDLVRSLKDDAANFLEEEKSKMRTRIREFESAQLALYQDLESSILSSNANLEDQIWAVFDEAYEEVDSAFERSVEEISVDSSPSAPMGKEGRSSSVVDDMFDLDPFGYEGDQEEVTDDGDDIFAENDTTIVPNYQSRSSNRGTGNADAIAKSVPIPIMGQFRVSVSGSYSDEDTTPRPQDMQASIKALAQSVGGDGTEMFGDLPRSRFNTGGTRRSRYGDY